MIEIKELNRYFSSNQERFYALKNINLTINSGEFILLNGISGSGKTTLLSIIAGIDKPNSGVIRVDDEIITKLPDEHLSTFRNKKISLIFQNYNLLEKLTVYDNLVASLIPMRLSLKEIDKKVQKSLEIANISHKKYTIANRLSGGEKQRTAIARALVTDAPIILCDEPTANLDRANKEMFLDILQKLYRLNKTIIVSTHDPIFQYLDYIDRTIYMESGEIVS